MQFELDLIPRKVGTDIIVQRVRDGYINATAMCKAAGALWADYRRLRQTEAFFQALSSDMGIPISELVQSLKGGEPRLQGTWVHPQVAIHLAQWLSPRFAVMVTQWVYDWLHGHGPVGARALPYHLRRYVMNQNNVPDGHFSILNEMAMMLIGPLEALGYRLPERLWPDISQGRMFCRHLREAHGIDTDSLPSYTHLFEDSRPPIQAKAYPETLLVAFRRYVREVWMPQRAAAYFRERDPAALKYLPRLLPPPRRKAS